MNYAFFGTPRFAAIFLENLIKSGLPPRLIIASPERPQGRKGIIIPSPVRVLAEENKLPFLQPESLKNIDLSPFQGIEVGFVAAYAKIIPLPLLQAFPKGIIGIHPSLLPRHRGSSPIQTALLEGDLETGTSIYLMDEKIDHGPLLVSERVPLSDQDSTLNLTETLANLGADLVRSHYLPYAEGALMPQEQNHALATFTRKFTRSDGYLPPDLLQKALNGDEDSQVLISRKFRALSLEPGIWTISDALIPHVKDIPAQKEVKILDLSFDRNRFLIKKIQIAGKNPRVLSN